MNSICNFRNIEFEIRIRYWSMIMLFIFDDSLERGWELWVIIEGIWFELVGNVERDEHFFIRVKIIPPLESIFVLLLLLLLLFVVI